MSVPSHTGRFKQEDGPVVVEANRHLAWNTGCTGPVGFIGIADAKRERDLRQCRGVAQSIRAFTAWRPRNTSRNARTDLQLNRAQRSWA